MPGLLIRRELESERIGISVCLRGAGWSGEGGMRMVPPFATEWWNGGVPVPT
jgi:hypothetical protein